MMMAAAAVAAAVVEVEVVVIAEMKDLIRVSRPSLKPSRRELPQHAPLREYFRLFSDLAT
jgi:hypothetical protein